ncbi:hypothetical protein GH714_004437 [Hevea brasiliensis]|uniref:Uncharacterized protein n=1 Tax=Hevea brasiliensis TaxID=3981 RepID=A0A6A6KXK0_HEVBR|nr:hypothetical protein GH714_004437 [Hevea brasiliensis]
MVSIQRVRLLYCLEACGFYKEAENEGFGVLERLRGLDLGEKKKRKEKLGGFVPSVVENGDAEFAKVVVEVVVAIVKCVALEQSKAGEDYRKVIGLVEEVAPWFSFPAGCVPPSSCFRMIDLQSSLTCLICVFNLLARKCKDMTPMDMILRLYVVGLTITDCVKCRFGNSTSSKNAGDEPAACILLSDGVRFHKLASLLDSLRSYFYDVSCGVDYKR